MSLSHWGMFDARSVPYVLWPLAWANFVDVSFWADVRAIFTEEGMPVIFRGNEVHFSA